MADEFIEAFDEKGNSIGRVTRSEAHARNLLHNSVHILLFNSRGELFVQRRSLSKDLYPGKLAASASGHVDYGESVEDAAKRELKEELGVSGLKLTPVFQANAFTESERESCFYFKAVLPAGKRVKPNESELIKAESRFYSWGELEALGGKGISPSLSIAIEKHRQGVI